MTRGWDDPRPVLVGVGGLLLIAAGVVQAFVVTLIVAVYGAPAMVLGVPVGLLAAADIVLGWRIRSGRNRRPALAAAFLTLLTVPFTLDAGLLTLTGIVSAMVAIVALTRYRAWFEPPPDEEPATDGLEPDVDDQGRASGEGSSPGRP